MFLLRVIVFFILVSLVLILGYPLIIIYDLAKGGDGLIEALGKALDNVDLG